MPRSFFARTVCALAFAASALVPSSVAQRAAAFDLPTPADFDPTYAGGGYMVDAAPGRTFVDASIAADGSVLMLVGVYAGFEIRAYTSDGNADPAFGIGGVVAWNDPQGHPDGIQPLAIARDSQGRVLVGARGSVLGEASGITLFRFSAVGVLDSAFAGDGIASTSLVPSNNGAMAVVVGSTDRVFVAWNTSLVSFSSAGVIDASFGTITIPTIERSTSATRDTSGKLVLAGTENGQMKLTRVTEAGASAQALLGSGQASSVICAAADTCFVGGQSSVNGLPLLVKVTGTGALDLTFGQGGTVVADIDRSSSDVVEGTWASLAIQSDGKVLGFGGLLEQHVVNSAFAAVVRFNLDGSIDNTFDGGQLLAIDAQQSQSVAQINGRIASLSNGKVLGTLQVQFEPGLGTFRLNGGSLNGPSFHPLPPSRVLDTRIGVGGPAAPFKYQEVRTLKVTGVGGVPPTGVGAVVLNVTVTQPNESGYLTVFPPDEPLPTASNLNFATGDTIANLVIAKIAADGTVAIFSAGTPHVIADIEGYFDDGTAPTGDRFHPLDPNRVLDTRLGIGVAQRLGTGTTAQLQVAGRGGVPQTGATAVVMNVTAAAPDSASYLTVWPTGQERPTASNLNFVSGKTIPNLVIVKLGPSGAINIYNEQGSVDVLADVVGWFGSDASEARFHPLPPERVMDTRGSRPGGGFQAGETRSLPLAGFGGIPNAGACAAVLNITATDATNPSYLTVWPTGQPLPTASNLNFRSGPAIPNLVIVKLGTQGSVDIFNEQGYVNVIVDVAGWFSC